jgi:hypothetical protein
MVADQTAQAAPMPDKKSDAEQKPKDCPLCGNVAILFPTNPSVQCCVCGCEVWGETIDEALTRWNTRTASE